MQHVEADRELNRLLGTPLFTLSFSFYFYYTANWVDPRGNTCKTNVN